MSARNEQTIARFFECWRRSDLEGALSFLSEDARFVPDLKGKSHDGKDAIRALWSVYMTKMQGYDFEERAIVSSDRLLFVERIETINSSKGVELKLPIVGIFEFDDAGLITVWRDYWDTSMAPGH